MKKIIKNIDTAVENGKKQALRNSFNEVVEPVIDWINKNYHPHTTIIINCNDAELLEGAMVFKKCQNNKNGNLIIGGLELFESEFTPGAIWINNGGEGAEFDQKLLEEHIAEFYRKHF